MSKIEAANIASQYQQKVIEMLCQAYRSGVPGAASAALEFCAISQRTTEERQMSNNDDRERYEKYRADMLELFGDEPLPFDLWLRQTEAQYEADAADDLVP